jgi:hypothetical protein
MAKKKSTTKYASKLMLRLSEEQATEIAEIRKLTGKNTSSKAICEMIKHYRRIKTDFVKVTDDFLFLAEKVEDFKSFLTRRDTILLTPGQLLQYFNSTLNQNTNGKEKGSR